MRKKPYTVIGIRRLKCFRCCAQAVHQWQVCADGNQYRPLCLACDVALNALVLRWMRDPRAARKIAAYRAVSMERVEQVAKSIDGALRRLASK